MFSVSGKTLKFAVVAKFQGVFFDQSGDGCREAAAALQEVECIYLAPKKGDVRIQDKMIEQLITDGIDGIAGSDGADGADGADGSDGAGGTEL